MDDLVALARAVMNAMLLGTVVLAWAALETPPSATDLGLNIYEMSLGSVVERRPPDLKAILEYMDLQKTGGVDDRHAISSLKVSHVLTLQSARLAFVFPLTPLTPLPAAQQKKVQEIVNDITTEIAKIATDRDESRVRKRIWPLDSIALSASAERFARYLHQLSVLFEEAKATEDTTFAELDMQASPRIKLPVIEESVERKRALIVLSLGIIGMALYLLSICNGIKAAAHSIPDQTGASWLFFHPGRLGIVVGSLWLVSPCGLLLWAWSQTQFRDRSLVALSSVLGSLALWTIGRALTARRAYRSNDSSGERQMSSSRRRG